MLFLPRKNGLTSRLKWFKIALRLEIFERDWNLQASHPPTPYSWGEFCRSELNISSAIEVFKRDWKCQARFIFFNLERWGVPITEYSNAKSQRPIQGFPGNPFSGSQMAIWGLFSFRAAKPAEVCLWNFWWSLIWNSIWNLKFPMGKIWWNFWGGLFYLPGKHEKFRSEFRGKFRSKFRRKFRKLRFKFRDFLRKLRSAEGRC